MPTSTSRSASSPPRQDEPVDEGERDQRADDGASASMAVRSPTPPPVTTITAPRPAPPVMPRRPGSASGLRHVAWTRRAGQREGGAGRSAAATTRGARSSSANRDQRRGLVARSQSAMSPVRNQVCPASRPSSRVPARPARRRARAPATNRRRLRTPTRAAGRLPGRSGVAAAAGQDDQHDSAGDGGGDAGRDRDAPRRRRAGPASAASAQHDRRGRRPGRRPGSGRT